MAQNYEAWPTKANIDERLTSAGLSARDGLTQGYYDQVVSAVVALLHKKTHRQFLKGEEGEIRYFDGNGTGSIVIDEFVAIEEVQVIGYVGGNLSMTLSNAISADSATFPKNRILIFQSSLPQLNVQYLNYFPRGRRNIKVTAQYGYAEYIPDDIWFAVCGKAAAILAAEAVQGGTGGRVRKWIEGDAQEDLDLTLPGEAVGWDAGFKDIIKSYRKPMRARRDFQSEMI